MSELCTSIEQSKKLIELGLDVDTADMCWSKYDDGQIRVIPMKLWDLIKDGLGCLEFTPAWSLSALLKLMPNSLMLQSSDLGYYKVTYKGVSTNPNNYYKNPLDAAYGMVVYLLKNDIIKDKCMKSIKEKAIEVFPRHCNANTDYSNFEKRIIFTRGANYVLECIENALNKSFDELSIKDGYLEARKCIEELKK